MSGTLRFTACTSFFKGQEICFIPQSVFSEWLDFSAKECLFPLSIYLSLRLQTPWRPEGILSNRRCSSILSFWCLVNAELRSRCNAFQDEMTRLIDPIPFLPFLRCFVMKLKEFDLLTGCEAVNVGTQLFRAANGACWIGWETGCISQIDTDSMVTCNMNVADG